MAQCELCGKVTRTTQGLRGHKTFIHGLYADHTKAKTTLDKNQPMDETSNLVEPDNNSINGYQERLNKLESEVVIHSELLNDLKWKVRALQNKLSLIDTTGDIDVISIWNN